MGKPTLYGADYSVYVRIARLALAEKGVAHELVPLDSFAIEARTPTSKAIPVVLHPHDPAQSGAQARDIPAAVVG